MRTATAPEWIKIAIQSWLIFGAVLGVLGAFDPALTFLSLHDTLPTIVSIVVASAAAGALHGFLAFKRFSSDFAMEVPVTRMVVIVWGTVLGGVLYSMFFLLPAVETASLRPLLTRCLLGCVSGLLASGLVVGRTHPA